MFANNHREWDSCKLRKIFKTSIGMRTGEAA